MATSTAYRLGKWVIVPAGIASLIIGIAMGGFQILIHVGFYKAGARGVTLEHLYLVAFFWAAWCAVSLGYVACGLLVQHRRGVALALLAVLAVIHLSATFLVLLGLGMV